jgi:segregation and condensation protein A
VTDLSQPIADQVPVAASGTAPLVAAEGKVAATKSTKNDASDFPFAIALGEIYEGPLDLLLDLIRKQDINIYDIPIARITAQYLVYVERIRELDVNIASEFIYMAAVLIHIKSKMLLPRATNWSTGCSSTKSSSPRPRCSCKNSRLKMRC